MKYFLFLIPHLCQNIILDYILSSLKEEEGLEKGPPYHSGEVMYCKYWVNKAWPRTVEFYLF